MRWIAYRFYKLFASLNRWMKRRLTPAGWVVLVGLILTGGMATDTDQSLGYQAFTLLACLALAALIVAPFFRIRFSAQRFLPRFGSAGQPLRYTITIRNVGRRAQFGLQVLDGLDDPLPTLREFTALSRAVSRKSFALSL